jgi:putative tryptophan/tyrosine transport system substrate-binding protein
MKPRDCFTYLVGFLAAWPLAATAQAPSKPVIGFLHAQSSESNVLSVTKFREGLSEEGYVEGRNVAIEFRWANNATATLPALAANLVQHRAAVIVTAGGMVAARAAKAATTTIPIVFITGLDPAENGFVESLNRPGGNATGVATYSRELVKKRLELLRELVGPAAKIAFLINADERGLGPGAKKQVEAEKNMALQNTDLVLDVASGKCLQIIDLHDTSCAQDQIAPSFAEAAKQGMGALLVGSDPFFTDRYKLLVALAGKYALPASYQQREFAEAGGLMSYGPSTPDSLRQAGRYAGRILKGANPADMPVLTPEKLELVINLKTAKTLGLAVPASLFPDEIIK